jgi:predicted acetyltransferase
MLDNIKIRKAKESEKETIKNLFQLYSYDFSEIYLDDVDEKGLYPCCRYIDEYYTDKDRGLYIILVNNNPAGFFMINKYTYLLPEGTNSISEFFVMRKYRRNKLGMKAANYIFDNYTGRMEIRVLKRNLNAIPFWSNVIDKRNPSNHEITEMNKNDEDWIVHDILI